jgi:hypothetical protein
LTFKVGKKASQALLVEGAGAGGTLLPAVRGQPAPVGPGDDAANWASFSDPVIAPDGTYAFAGKVSGSAKTANGVWTNMSGTLQLALRQGSPVPGLTEKLASVLSISMESNALIALVKLAAPAGTNIALVRLDNANAGHGAAPHGANGSDDRRHRLHGKELHCAFTRAAGRQVTDGGRGLPVSSPACPR